MSRKIFVNLPVQDLQKSLDFFSRLGFTFDQRFTDDKAACVVVGDDSYAMLLTTRFFASFTPKEVCDTSRYTEAIVTLSADSRAGVDELAEAALAAGGQPAKEPMDEQGMYGRSFQDLDGRVWEVFWMDPAAAAG